MLWSEAVREFNPNRMEAAQTMHQATKVSGGGAVRYEAEVFLHNGYICHCTICQRSTGQTVTHRHALQTN